MTVIVLKRFNGLTPIVTPRLLGPENAQLAENVRLISGALAPLRGVSTLKATDTVGPKTIFRYGNSSTETDYWLEFANDTDVMRSPIASDQWDRLYWTDGANVPRYAPNSMILSGATYPGASFELGLPAPSTAIQVTSFSAPTSYSRVTRNYVLTYYAASSNKESGPGPIFSVLCVDGFAVSFSGLPTSNLGDSTITKKRLYRKVGSAYKRVAELDLDVTVYEDTATDASLSSAQELASALSTAPQTPTQAPYLSAASTAGVSTTAISRSYVYTVKNISYLYTPPSGSVDDTYWKALPESAASPAISVSADETQSVTLTGFVNSAGGEVGSGGFNLYRKDADSNQYLLVASLPAGTTSFVDVLGTTKLGATLTSTAPSEYAPASALFQSTNTSTSSPAVRRVYMVTFVDSADNESARGPASDAVDVIDGVTAVSISHSESVPSGVTTKRLYRQTLVGSGGDINDANWKLVLEGSASATSFSDTAADSTLTTTLNADLRNLPPTPAFNLIANATIPSDEVPESRTYVYTYVSAYGEEGPPSSASSVVDVNPESSVSISLGAAPTGNYNVSLKRIYRSSTVGSQAKFQFVAEIPVGQTAYTDSVEQANLGEVLPSEEWVAPPAGLKGLRMMANGSAVGFVGRTLYLSEPNLPHAWPHQYTIDDDIVGIGVFGQSVAVLTKSFPYLFQGVDPAAMSQNKLRLPQACVSKRSIVETGDGVVYASPDGLVSIGAGVSLMTQGAYSREQWQAFYPASMDCYLHNGRVIVFYTKASDERGGLIFDISGQGAALTTTNINSSTAITAGYYEPKTDTLYLAQGLSIVRYDSGSDLSMRWRSKVYRLNAPENLGVAQVRAFAYPLTLKIYADGGQKHEQTVANASPFRLPAGFKGLDWEFEILGTKEVTEVAIASSAAELRMT